MHTLMRASSEIKPLKEHLSINGWLAVAQHWLPLCALLVSYKTLAQLLSFFTITVLLGAGEAKRG